MRTSVRVLTGLIMVALAACAKSDPANQLPTVEITTRPQGERVSYAVDIFWTGSDRDGTIDHYQYTVDVPADITLDQLNDPEFNGVTWTDTDAPGAMFLFATPTPDTLFLDDGTLIVTDLYVGDHNLFVRAVDNDGAVSQVDYIEFTAENVAPKAEMAPGGECATPFSEYVSLQGDLPINFGGIDPDRPGADKSPAFFEWKRIPVNGGIVEPDLEFLISNYGRHIMWQRVSADSPHVTVTFDPPNSYVLAVRAIDVHGAVETRFEAARNAIRVSTGFAPGLPTLVVRERMLGEFSDASPLSAEIPAGVPMTFDFSSARGGVPVTGYCALVDPEDLDNCEWSPTPSWTVTFDTPGIHAIQFLARDCLGRVAVASLTLRVVAMAFDRELLYVDDFRQAGADAPMDAMIFSMLDDVGFSMAEGTLHVIEPWGPGDLAQEPEPLRLSDMARYKIVMWSVLGTAYNGNPALVLANACPNGRVLQAYVAAGGSLWVHGQAVMAAFKKFPGGLCRADVTYGDNAGLWFSEPEFISEFLHITGGDFRTVKTNPQTNGLVRARPNPRAASALFPPLEVDSTLFTSTTLGGIPLVDAMFEPLFGVAGVDTVYVADATAGVNSGFRNKPIGFRYADPDPVPGQGPVAVFGFPLHFFKQGSVTGSLDEGTIQGTGVKGMAAAMFRWFRQHGAVAQAGLAGR